jgi:hypothetical protein
MSDGKSDLAIETGTPIGPAGADVLVDPIVLDDLARDASLWPSAAVTADEALVLSLEELLPDVEGTVIMLSDAGLPVNLVTDELLAGSGVVGEPVSAGGFDVEGLFYYSFANGLTLYSDTDIVIVSETTGA